MSMSIEDDFYFHFDRNMGSNATPRGPNPPMTLCSPSRIGVSASSQPFFFISSTYTDKNSPFSRLTNKHSQFGTFPSMCSFLSDEECLCHDYIVNFDKL